MITDWLTAVGTIAVAIIAVFQDQIRSWFKRPRIEVSISVAPPDCHKTTLVQTLNFSDSPPVSFKADCYYFRIRVRNAGNERAEHVEVFASELLKQRADGSFRRVDSFLPMNLLWSHIRRPFATAISPKMEKHCDLGHIIDPTERQKFSERNPSLNVGDDKTTMSFDVEVSPLTMGHIIAPGKYRLHLLIGAGNSKPVSKTLEISLTGTWFNDERTMLAEGIGIKII